MKTIDTIIVMAVAALLVGCAQSPVSHATAAPSLPLLEAQDGRTVSVFGTIAKDPVPTLILTSHRVGNGRNIIRLKWRDSGGTLPFAPGTAVHVSGVLTSQNLKVPEIVIESIEEKIGPNQQQEGIRR